MTEHLIDQKQEIDKNSDFDKVNNLKSRAERFVDISQINDFNPSQLRCFYQGDIVYKRMEEVRKSIYYIRKNWNMFDQFMNKLKDFLTEESEPFGGLSDSVKNIFTSKRNWCDIEEKGETLSTAEDESNPKEKFNVLYTYTTDSGFNEVFKIINNILQDDLSVNVNEKILSAVFLIELINIDLYNYVKKYPQFQNFEGIVYRGMIYSNVNLDIFKKLTCQPIENRYISVPLGLWSATCDLGVAINCIRNKLSKDCVPLLLKIQVLNLDDKLLLFYRKRYKESVVSTICAVYVGEISQFQEEKEVLLRGGFYQVLNIYSQVIDGLDCKVLDLVMLNTNRDHLYNPTCLGDSDDEARILFGNMVGCTRNKYIVNYCKEQDLHADMLLYENALNNNEIKLKELME